jgi:membrane protein implicated in regulation of membrane protease activity
MQDDLDEEFIGRFATAEADFEKDAEGKVTFNGTLWTAIAESNIKKGEKVKIVGRENITLKIKSTKN